MTVLDYDTGQRFIIRTIKYHQSNPSNKFANSYELQATEGGDGDVLQAAASSIVLFEQTMMLNVIRFDHMIISTWEPDSKPYDPAVFMSIPVSGGGAQSAASDPLALTSCVSVARVAASGRFGHLFYRGWLKEGDTAAPAGKTILTDPTAFNSTLQGAVDSSGFGDYIGTESVAGMRLVMVNKSGSQTRVVNSLVTVGVTQLPIDHAWFNRTTAP